MNSFFKGSEFLNGTLSNYYTNLLMRDNLPLISKKHCTGSRHWKSLLSCTEPPESLKFWWGHRLGPFHVFYQTILIIKYLLILFIARNFINLGYNQFHFKKNAGRLIKILTIYLMYFGFDWMPWKKKLGED